MLASDSTEGPTNPSKPIDESLTTLHYPNAGRLLRQKAHEPIPGYTLVERLGRGGFGEVWKALGPGGVPVALKFVRLDEGAAAREARALEFMKFVSHPHLMTHFGIWNDDDLLIIGMELADGTLHQRLKECQAQGDEGIPFSELIDYMREAAQGIDFLNESQHTLDGREGVSILHRDIKPHNLLLFGGSVKVADFGLARILERSVSNKTGGLTVAYAPPEFFQGEVTRQSDQYSLAVSYCQLRGGRTIFEGTPLEVMAGHLSKSPDLTMLPEDERPIVAKALQKSPRDRYASCRDFVEALRNRAIRLRPQIGMPELPRLVHNSLGMQLVLIPAGSFLIGAPPTEPQRQADEAPLHRVEITRSFYMSMFPVTQQQYQMVMGQNPSQFNLRAGGSPSHPVESVSWFDAMEFCRRLSQRYEERQFRREYHLPTEAEWEYACRAGTESPFGLGETLSRFEANFDWTEPYGPVPLAEPLAMTSMVGSYAANAWGVYDLHGNVWEWCADWYSSQAYQTNPERDPLGPRWGTKRVIRGGAWDSPGRHCRSAKRNADVPTAVTPTIGFRVVMLPQIA
ncbi:bifunctional serine/threonine-protein kinase/formylglycine-generating enzyme family protein [Tuwongella immobilis]|uniref:Protein kinase domain-containing protein n=1 Tax=Tuwongella immobilis TaxID=692036 RepID=A0A6C2YJH3_9BACT|nr:bifunctional serine/threonine-protein kinase/formylglycine-generating enzyme family protein [Tuwongella immobilis]VIP01566.1 serine threonine protein kinase : Genome sequencing data, contig C319 OS=Microcystis sp. T1-4 GN=MICAI_3480001 PE=4 SV=1: Pkinase: FGE-sulfatase [Tuwongella immobilis]VTR98789.1 serine threonine protein kinase : Genome sequencing data, contig C319 OS=Microcystis sp. T1-4 GN=MICAI_3480001 PE=4 SV=1: Pkinase: FGE-sulfatase [Tuwongella immobilis]